MDQTREKRSHQSKFVKQLCYYTIVVTLQIRSVLSIEYSWYWKLFFSLTVAILLMTTAGKSISMYDTKGRRHDLKSSTVLMILGIGWVAFSLCLLFNILYYALHPSKVSLKNINKIYLNIIFCFFQVDLKKINEKLVVGVFGYEIKLLSCSVKGQKHDTFRYIFTPSNFKIWDLRRRKFCLKVMISLIIVNTSNWAELLVFCLVPFKFNFLI